MIHFKMIGLFSVLACLSACSSINSSSRNITYFSKATVYDVTVVSKQSISKEEFDHKLEEAIYKIEDLSEASLKEAVNSIGFVSFNQHYTLVPSDANAVTNYNVKEPSMARNIFQTNNEALTTGLVGKKEIFSTIITEQTNDRHQLFLKASTRQGNSNDNFNFSEVVDTNKTYPIASYEIKKDIYNLLLINAQK